MRKKRGSRVTREHPAIAKGWLAKRHESDARWCILRPSNESAISTCQKVWSNASYDTLYSERVECFSTATGREQAQLDQLMS